MSKYTTEVRFLCESLYNMEYSNAKTVDNVVKAVHNKIFNFTYPIFDANYKSILECKILKHFYTREISEETVGLWKLRLNSKMNEIMPYYNLMYESNLLKINPLDTHGLTRSYNKEGNTQDNTSTIGEIKGNRENQNSSNSNVLTDDKRINKFSDTPQGSISNLEDDTYLTNATIETNENNSQSQTGENLKENSLTESSEKQNKKINSLEEYIENVTGFEGVPQSELLMKWRESFINVDMMIINDLEPLFFGLW